MKAKENISLNIIENIKNGIIDPSNIEKETRISCVEILMLEGYKCPEIAKIFNKSDKTIRRDISEIMEKNALSIDIKSSKEIIGDFYIKSRNTHSNLLKLARSKEASVAERSQAEYYAHLCYCGTISKLQSLGYLPNASKSIVGDIYLHNTNNDNEAIKILEQELFEMNKLSPNNKEITKIEAITNQYKEEIKDE